MAKKQEKPAKNCLVCGSTFQKDGRLSRKQWSAQRFCSITCRAAGDSEAKKSARPPLEVLFRSSYAPDAITGCWNWIGTLSTQGYGVMRWRGETFRAHMLSLELSGQPRPPEAIACHHCDNPRCVNPAHIYWGTPADNARDAQSRGRLHVGVLHHNSKLTPDAVRCIRQSGETNTELAVVFGVTRQAIRAVRAGLNWRHIQ